MAKKRLLSSLTSVGYGLIFVIVVIISAVLVQIGIFGLGDKDEPITGLTISSENLSNNTLNIITEDAEEQISLLIQGNSLLEDAPVEGSSVKVKLSIRNSSGDVLPEQNRAVYFLLTDANGNPILDSSDQIQTVKDVEVGINDTVKLVLATYQDTNPYIEEAVEQTYIKGGTCYIEAYSSDGRFKASKIKINVDVPVESIEVTVNGYNKSGQLDDLTNIVNDTVATYKEESSVPLATIDNFNSVILYTGESNDNYEKGKYYKCVQNEKGDAYVWAETDMQYFIKNDKLTLGVRAFPSNSLNASAQNEKNVQFNKENFSEEVASLDSTTGALLVKSESGYELKIKAKVLKLLGQSEQVEALITVNIAKLEIDEINIGNQDVKSGGVFIKVGETLKFSASSSSAIQNQSNVTNLNLSIRSKHYTYGADPLSENLSGLVIYMVDNHSTENPLPANHINISSMDSNFWSPLTLEQWDKMENENNTGWDLTANRQLITKENIDLYVAAYNTSGSFDSEKPYAHIGVTISSVTPNSVSYIGEDSISITKYDAGWVGTDILDSIDLTQSFINWTTENGAQLTWTKWVYFLETSYVNINEVGSPIIEVTEAGQVARSEGGEVQLSQTLLGLGAGKVRIRAYLVRTNSDGEPIDCRYNVISESENTGYITKSEADIKQEEHIGQYVVEYSVGSYFEIVVQETLSEVQFYYDEELELKVQEDQFDIGTTQTKNLYVRANSMLALKSEFYNLSVDKEVSQVDEDFVVVAIDNELIERMGEDSFYTKIIMSISVYSFLENEFTVILKQNDAPISYLLLNAKDIEVSSVRADWSGELEQVYENITTEEGVRVMNVYGDLEGFEVGFYYMTGAEASDSGLLFKLPHNVLYTYNIAGAEQGNFDLSPYKTVALEYKVYALTDEQLLQAKEGTLVWGNDLLCSTISTKTVRSEDGVTGLKICLREGWKDETKNIILAYRAVSEDYVRVDFYKLNILNSTADAEWDGTATTQFTSENYSTFSLDFWDITIKQGEVSCLIEKSEWADYVSISLSDNVTDYFEIGTNKIVIKEGYKFSASDTDKDNVLEHNTKFTVKYLVYDSGSNIVFMKSIDIYLTGFIEVE